MNERPQLRYNKVLQEVVSNQREVLTEMNNSNSINGGKIEMVEIAHPKTEDLSKIVICCLLPYELVTFKEYTENLSAIFNEVFLHGKDFIFVFNQTNEQSTVPNQLVISLLLQYILKTDLKKVKKIRLVSEDRNICTLIRYEILKESEDHRREYRYERLKINELEPSI